MKIIVTGSLGHISKPLTSMLLEQGHEVTVVSSQEGRREAIEAMGARAAIGSIADVPFLTGTFRGADVVYAMSPPNFATADMVAYQADNGRDYAEAIRASGVKRLIFLSSFGAHRASGTGIIVGKYHAEQALAELQDVSITIMRPTSFYYNFNSFAGMIKSIGFIAANYGADDVIPLVAPEDIARAIAAEIAQPATPGVHIRYVVSDERNGHEVAAVLGAAIGKPDLEWKLIPNERMQAALEGQGLAPQLAADLTEMYAGLHNGNMGEHYQQHKPDFGSVKLEDFAKEFADIYQQDGPTAVH